MGKGHLGLGLQWQVGLSGATVCPRWHGSSWKERKPGKRRVSSCVAFTQCSRNSRASRAEGRFTMFPAQSEKKDLVEGVEQLVAGGEEGRDVFPVQAQPLAALSIERLASLAAFRVPGKQNTQHTRFALIATSTLSLGDQGSGYSLLSALVHQRHS